MKSSARSLFTIAAFAAILVLTACSRSSLVTTPSDTGVPVTAAASNSNSTASQDVVIAVAADPIDAYLAAAKADWRTAVRVHLAANQDKIAQCVKAKGFEYYPATPVPVMAPVNKNSQQWVEQHGYGLSNADRATEAMMDSLDTPYGVESPDEIAYERSLSAAEDDAYTIALFGSNSGSAPGGCSASRVLEPRFTPAYSTMENAIDGLDGFKVRAASDAKTLAANSDWAACMTAAGDQGFSEPSDALTKATSLYPQLSKSPGAGALTGAQTAAAHKAEVALALDDFDCKLKTHYLQRTTAVLYAMEDAWISSHKAVLDDVIAGYKAASK